jgi:hypothetical protein
MAQRLPLAPGGAALARNQNIKVVGTAIGSPTAIHTSGGTDEVWLEAVNTDTVPHTLYVLVGIATLAGGASPDDTVPILLLPKTGLKWILKGSTVLSGAIVAAYADTTNVVNVRGHVNRVG